MWILPVYDRTQEDIDNKTSKAFLNASDLNRIEGNSDYLRGLIDGGSFPLHNYTYTSFPTESLMQSIIDNIDTLKAIYPVAGIDDTPDNPLNTFQKINTIERIQWKIMDHIEKTAEARMYCGEGYANDIGIL